MSLASDSLLTAFEKKKNIRFSPLANLKGNKTSSSTTSAGEKRAPGEGSSRPPPKKPCLLSAAASSGEKSIPITSAASHGSREALGVEQPSAWGDLISRSPPNGAGVLPISGQSSMPNTNLPPPPPSGHNPPPPPGSVNQGLPY
ncbi:mRNA 3'-end-processing protein RNA14-like [Lotus japonicus]|uniref:mRNA 3'-end-processing protein RNA14-like n=1 Tax=Lotus japonicus TaxID=34305 RepID=UPI0025906507|nr:mRNA 3'-end-processing protein RNA14-like [Lotus japonicus]